MTLGRRRWALGSVAVVLAFGIAPASAETASVSVADFVFTPAHRQVSANDTILWVWAASGHNVTAFSGASFASGDRQKNATYTQTFPGGVVKYRCTNHSTLSGGDCTGMCGLITERPVDFTAPSVGISRPTQGQVLVPIPRLQGGVGNPVVVAGGATDNIGVLGVMLRLYDTTGRAVDTPATCAGCGDAQVQWSVDLSLLPGSYVAEARATDTSGNVAWSPRTSFFVV